MKKFAPFIAILFVFLMGCSANRQINDTSFVMGTFLSQTYTGDENIARQNLGIASGIEKEMSKTMAGSDIKNLNAQGTYKVSPETAYVIETALKEAAKTNGAFNPALNPIIELWGIGERETDVVPGQAQIDVLLTLTDYHDVKLDSDGTVHIVRGGGIDLGGIAKGYALDRLAENMKKNNIGSALVDLGGSLAVIGAKADGQKYKIGVRDPDGGQGDYIATVELADTFTSTSGVYEKYFIKDGIRYHHIMDSTTGKPAESGVVAVMIVTSSGILSDIYSTALFVMGAQKGLDFANRNGIDALFITNDKKIRMTDGFAQKYAFELAADGYEVV